MLEYNTSAIFHLLMWIVLIYFLMTIMMMGFWFIQYQRFTNAMQETVARVGTFHKGGGDPWYINDRHIIDLIHAYHDQWVIVPVANPSSYDPNNLSLSDPSSYNPNSLSLSAIKDNLIPVGKNSGVTVSLLNHSDNAPIQANDLVGRTYNGNDPQMAASDYNGNRELRWDSLGHIELKYWNLNNFDSQAYMDGAYPGLSTKERTDKINKLKVTWNADKSSYCVYDKVDDGVHENVLWNNLIHSNGDREPRTQYARDLSYIIIPNNALNTDHSGSAINQSAHDHGFADRITWKSWFGKDSKNNDHATWETKLLNSHGEIIDVSNQIRSNTEVSD